MQFIGIRAAEGAFCAIVAILAGTGILMVAPPTAEAHDHKPPPARLLYEPQRGKLRNYCWTEMKSFALQEYCWDSLNSYDWPGAAQGKSRSQIRIRIEKSLPPTKVRFKVYRRVASGGRPIGKPLVIEPSLESVVTPDGLAWDLVADSPRGRRPLFIALTGHWRDEDGSGRTQHAEWLFALQLN